VSGEIRYYKGLHKVKVVTESEGYWIVEALEEFEDTHDGEKVTVKVGEQRIVPPRTVHKHKNLPPPIKEHAYELKMEKKLKRKVAQEEKKQTKKK
jgi:mannose-6-phosphate isomerase-like protein (cupin superfamily)